MTYILNTRATRLSDFHEKLLANIFRQIFAFQSHNVDTLRFKTDPVRQVVRQFKDVCLASAKRMGFVYMNPHALDDTIDRLIKTWDNIDGFESTYSNLADDHSRQTLIEVLTYRILGSQHVRMSINNDEYWKQQASVQREYMLKRAVAKVGTWQLDRYRIKGQTRELDIVCLPSHILNTFLLEQYVYQRGPNLIKANVGDNVIDAGGGWGDSALYFADRVSESGKVYSFEFVPSNLRVFKRNLDHNPQLAKTIKVLPKPLWERSGELVHYSADGTSSRINQEGQQTVSTASTVSIDDLTHSRQIGNVDFIKMDIEGAEVQALRGAEATIRRFQPKLAISVYHKDDDIISILEYINDLQLNYIFYLDHFTLHSEETVLFAVSEGHLRG